MLLSNARNNTERTARVYKELSQAAQISHVKEAVEARAFSPKKPGSAGQMS